MSGLKTSRLDTLGHILENVRWWLWEVPVGVKGTKEQGSGSQLLCSPCDLGQSSWPFPTWSFVWRLDTCLLGLWWSLGSGGPSWNGSYCYWSKTDIKVVIKTFNTPFSGPGVGVSVAQNPDGSLGSPVGVLNSHYICEPVAAVYLVSCQCSLGNCTVREPAYFGREAIERQKEHERRMQLLPSTCTASWT